MYSHVQPPRRYQQVQRVTDVPLVFLSSVHGAVDNSLSKNFRESSGPSALGHKKAKQRQSSSTTSGRQAPVGAEECSSKSSRGRSRRVGSNLSAAGRGHVFGGAAGRAPWNAAGCDE
mmetsp:Transcript_50024/g.140237  ORF Transcript_50024/g.140237 Transcript_50024/m.140237 type:complete len:117 (-) Transcript_50024:102-452(-)